jgi:hypothetical protein
MPRLGLLTVVAAALAVATRDTGGDELYRPEVDVSRDPDAYYSAALYTPMPEPQPGDWMAEHPETARNFVAYVRSRPNRPSKARHTIVVVPVGEITPKARALLGTLTEYLGIT